MIESYVHSVHNYPPHTHSLTLPPNSEHHLGGKHSFIHFQVSCGSCGEMSGGNTATTSLAGVVAAMAMATAAVCLP